MKTLSLGNQHFTGTLPTELGNLYGVLSLTLSGNKLSGPIPSELGLLDSNTEIIDLIRKENSYRNVTRIALNDNDLTGTVPASLGMLGMLKTLLIYNNTGLTGTIPAAVCNLSSWPEAGGINLDCQNVNCTCGACLCV